MQIANEQHYHTVYVKMQIANVQHYHPFPAYPGAIPQRKSRTHMSSLLTLPVQ